MGDPRAILTDREKEILRDPSSVTDSYYRSVVSTIRTKKIDKLAEDLNHLDEYHTELAERMRRVVCERDETAIRLDRETWKQLNVRREPGEELEDVIRRILTED